MTNDSVLLSSIGWVRERLDLGPEDCAVLVLLPGDDDNTWVAIMKNGAAGDLKHVLDEAVVRANYDLLPHYD